MTGGSTRRDVGRRLGDALEVPSRVPRNRRSGRGATSLETRLAPGARLLTSTRARGARPLFGASAVARAGCARSRRGLSRVVPPSSTKRLMTMCEKSEARRSKTPNGNFRRSGLELVFSGFSNRLSPSNSLRSGGFVSQSQHGVRIGRMPVSSSRS